MLNSFSTRARALVLASAALALSIAADPARSTSIDPDPEPSPPPRPVRRAPTSGGGYSGGGYSGGNRAAAMIGVAGALIGALGSMRSNDDDGAERSRAQEEADEAERVRVEIRKSRCQEMRENNTRGRNKLAEKDFLSAIFYFDQALDYAKSCGDLAAENIVRSNLELANRLKAAENAAEEEQYKREQEEAERQRLAEEAKAREQQLAREAAAREQERIREAQAREERRLAACRTARSEHEAGSGDMNMLQPASAIAHYTQAAAAFAVCGQQSNVGVAQHNLGLAQRMLAVMQEEAGRAGEAQRRYGANAPYGAGDPFAASGRDAVPKMERASVRIDVANLYGEASKLCAGSGEKGSPAWDKCLRYAQAAVIGKYDPDIAGYCNADTDPEGRIDCTVNRYANTLAGRVRFVKASAPQENVYEGIFDGRPGRSKSTGSALRDKLRERLKQMAEPPPAGPPAAPPPAPTVNSGSAVAPGSARPTPRQSAQDEILDGLPQYTVPGKLPPPSSGISGP